MQYIEVVRRSECEWIVIVIDKLPLGDCHTYSFDSVGAALQFKRAVEFDTFILNTDVDWKQLEV